MLFIKGLRGLIPGTRIQYRTDQMKSNFSTPYMVYFIVLVMCLISFTTILLQEDTFLYLTQEDGPFETSGALLFFTTAILFFLLFFQNKKFAAKSDRARYNTKTKRIWFLLLALLFIFLTGEETSWGQRLFGWDGIEGNIQGESNFHNSPLFNYHKSKPGAEVEIVKTGIAALLTAKKIFVYIFISFLFLLPLSVKFVPFIRKIVHQLFIPVPAIAEFLLEASGPESLFFENSTILAEAFSY